MFALKAVDKVVPSMVASTSEDFDLERALGKKKTYWKAVEPRYTVVAMHRSIMTRGSTRMAIEDYKGNVYGITGTLPEINSVVLLTPVLAWPFDQWRVVLCTNG